MNIIRTANFDEMSRVAAEIIAAQVAEKPDSVVGLATGGTPIGIYECIAEMHRKGLDFSRVRAANLDEYEGLDAEHPQSYAYFMREHLFKFINIAPQNRHIPNGLAIDADAECRRYEDTLAELGGVDLQLLGIGHNGHIGFNEPDTAFSTTTNRVKLTDSTQKANARFFTDGEKQPEYAFTMGIGTIMAARKILLVASGDGKAEIMYKTLRGPVTPAVPASILQFHPDVTVVADAAALRMVDSEQCP